MQGKYSRGYAFIVCGLCSFACGLVDDTQPTGNPGGSTAGGSSATGGAHPAGSSAGATAGGGSATAIGGTGSGGISAASGTSEGVCRAPNGR